MECQPLAFDSGLSQYEQQAGMFLEGYRAGDAGVIRLYHERHPRFLDETIKWLPKDVSDAEVRAAGLGLADAQLTVARCYDFLDWGALAAYSAAVAEKDSPVYRFEAAVEAVIAGDLPALSSLLRKDPELVRAQSTRITHFNPSEHRAMLLHYVAANGVEGHGRRLRATQLPWRRRCWRPAPNRMRWPIYMAAAARR